MTKLEHFKKNWKLTIHLLFRTKHFGANNQWWLDFDSYFGWPWYKILIGIITVKPIINNYKGMKFRAKIGFISEQSFNEIWPNYKRRKVK